MFFCASITLRGVTVVATPPFSLAFVALAMANVVVVAFLIVCVSIILVWVPVYDGRSANHHVQLQVRRGPGTGGGGGRDGGEEA